MEENKLFNITLISYLFTFEEVYEAYSKIQEAGFLIGLGKKRYKLMVAKKSNGLNHVTIYVKRKGDYPWKLRGKVEYDSKEPFKNLTSWDAVYLNNHAKCVFDDGSEETKQYSPLEN